MAFLKIYKAVIITYQHSTVMVLFVFMISYFSHLNAKPEHRPLADFLPEGFKLSNQALDLLPSEQQHFLVLNAEQIIDLHQLALLNLNDQGGLALLAVANLKKGDALLYLGEQVAPSLGEQRLYALQRQFPTRCLAVDPEYSGSFARFVQHLPSLAEYQQYYLVAEPLSFEVAMANCEAKLVCYDDQFYYALVLTQDIEASLDSPRLLGFSYGMATYWHHLSRLPYLYGLHGEVLDVRRYCYRSDGKIQLGFTASSGKEAVLDPKMLGGDYELLLTSYHLDAGAGRVYDFTDYRHQHELKVGLPAPPLLIRFMRDEIQCQVLGQVGMTRTPKAFIHDYVPSHELSVEAVVSISNDQILNFMKAMPAKLSELLEELKALNFYFGIIETYGIKNTIQDLLILIQKNMAMSLWNLSQQIRDEQESKRLFSCARQILLLY